MEFSLKWRKKKLSKKFNIAQCTVSAIKLNRIWKEGGAICQ